MADYNKERRWFMPNKRAANYAEERKAKVHTHGSKEGKELTEYEKGLRSGYLQCQSDHAGLFRFKQAMDAFGDKEYAKSFRERKAQNLKRKRKKKIRGHKGLWQIKKKQSR